MQHEVCDQLAISQHQYLLSTQTLPFHICQAVQHGLRLGYILSWRLLSIPHLKTTNTLSICIKQHTTSRTFTCFAATIEEESPTLPRGCRRPIWLFLGSHDLYVMCMLPQFLFYCPLRWLQGCVCHLFQGCQYTPGSFTGFKSALILREFDQFGLKTWWQAPCLCTHCLLHMWHHYDT